MNFTVKSPGSCGELVQGVVDGQPFLITCPIDLYTALTVSDKRVVSSTLAEKSQQALSVTLDYLETGLSKDEFVRQFSFSYESALPVGKGMASSSADLSAVCQAVAVAQGRELTPDEIADICLAIEPTDGTFYSGIMLFDHVQGKIRRNLGHPPDMAIAILDVGGQVDTLSFHQRTDLVVLNKSKEKEVREATELVVAGLQRGDLSLIGQGATLSALANQAILYKPPLESLVRLSSRYGAYGINAAHSGTVLGLMFSVGQDDKVKACLEEIQGTCPFVSHLKTVRLIGGGVQVMREGCL